MEKVLTNHDLLTKILDYTGIEEEIRCKVCDKIIKYQIFYHKIEINDYKEYYDLEACKKIYVCDDECLENYKKGHNDTNCRIAIFASIIIIIVIIILFGIVIIR